MNPSIKIIPFCLYLTAVLLCFSACQSSTESEELDQIVIRLSGEPTTLSPMLSKSDLERELHEYLFLSLGDYHPKTLEIVPVLLEYIPNKKITADGRARYDVIIKKDAAWADGTPITGHDFKWTIKMAFHQELNNPSWKQLLQAFQKIEVDQNNPKKFTVLVDDDYLLTFEALLTAEIYPQHIYDKNGVLEKYTLEELKKEEISDATFSNLAKEFSSVTYNQEIVEGSGPYQLEKWETGQYISLKEKDNYWGNNYPNNPFLQSIPERLVFQIVPDETVALTLLKSDEIDFLNMNGLPAVAYEEFATNTADDDIEVHTLEIPRIYTMYINNEDSRLADRRVRKAINLLTNVDRMIDQIEGGYGTKMNSIIHPSKREYNQDLPTVAFDIEAANNLLEETGWIDTDNNGIRDKVINGTRQELSLRMFITGSSLSKSIFQIMSQDAKLAGVEITSVTKKFSDVRRDHLRTGDFELAPTRLTQPEAPYDPFIAYHSTSIGPTGSNYSRYSNPEADKQLEIIRESDDAAAQAAAYQKAQEIILEDYPVIFLYAPQGRIAIDDDIEPLLSIKRPGYFANGFKLLDQ